MDVRTEQQPFEERIRELLFSQDVYKENPLSETELAGLLGVSRGPVREALKVLQKEGIIERKQKKGLYLRKPSIKEIVEVFDARSAIEGFAGRLAVKKVKEKDLKELEKISRKHDKELKQGNYDKADTLDRTFHEKVIKLSGNKILQRMMDSFHILERAFKICYAIHSAVTIEYSPYSHDQVISCLRKRDAEEVEKILRYHAQWTKRWLVEQAMGISINHFEETK